MRIDLSGQRFGRLTVVSVDTVRRGDRFWLCVCDCGNTKTVNTGRLRNGMTKSCGCLRRETAAAHCVRLATHGHTGSAMFKAWSSMFDRCYNPRCKAFLNYGGRGIIVCDRWHQFENFLDDMPAHPGKGYTLDRIDNNGNYEPSNCRWATWNDQARNRRPRSCYKLT